MITKLGSTVTVRVLHGDVITSRRVNIISAGPPGVVGDWGLTLDGKREYLLVRKGADGSLYSIYGDRGELA